MVRFDSPKPLPYLFVFLDFCPAVLNTSMTRKYSHKMPLLLPQYYNCSFLYSTRAVFPRTTPSTICAQGWTKEGTGMVLLNAPLQLEGKEIRFSTTTTSAARLLTSHPSLLYTSYQRLVHELSKTTRNAERGESILSLKKLAKARKGAVLYTKAQAIAS